MEISVIGPGALGTLLGGLLASRRHRVVLVGKNSPSGDEGRGLPSAGPGDRSAPAAVVRVVLPDRWISAEVRRAGPGEAPASPDVALVTLGRHHLHVLRRPDFSRLTGGGGSPVALFNADPAELERLAVPPESLRLCVSLLSAVRLQESDVELASEKALILYESGPGARRGQLDRVFRELAGLGVQCTAVTDARPYLNSLLVWQLMFLPLAMCNTTLGVFLSFPEGRELAVGLLSEGCEAMDKAGMAMAALPVMDPRELLGRLEKKPDSFGPLPERPDRSFNSLLQGMLAGKPTEAPQLNRRIVEIASSAGLHLTWNWRILQKLSRVSGVGFYRTPGDLLRSLA